jgi:hypothetical protein
MSKAIATVTMFGFLALGACTSGDDDSGQPPDAGIGEPPDATVDPPVESDLPCGADEDQEIDGSVDIAWRYLYDQRGNGIRDEGDSDGDGEPDDIWEYEWTPGNQLAAMRELMDATLVYSSETTFEGEQRQVTVDDVDGAGEIPPDTTTFLYEEGRLSAETLDLESDQVIDSRTRYAYDLQGRIKSESLDEGDDGSVEERDRHTYDGDSDRVVTTVYDHPVGGKVEDRSTYLYDQDGRQVSHQRDNGQDGSIDYLRTSVYEDGHLVERVIDWDGDGPDPGLTMQIEYDDQGRYTEMRWTGSLGDTLWTYHYLCE